MVPRQDAISKQLDMIDVLCDFAKFLAGSDIWVRSYTIKYGLQLLLPSAAGPQNFWLLSEHGVMMHVLPLQIPRRTLLGWVPESCKNGNQRNCYSRKSKYGGNRGKASLISGWDPNRNNTPLWHYSIKTKKISVGFPLHVNKIWVIRGMRCRGKIANIF